MSEETASYDERSRYRAWILLGAVVFVHAACDFLFQPFGDNKSGRVIAMGVVFLQPILFASWATIGPPPFTKRIPLTIAAFAAIVLAGALGDKGWLTPDYLTVAVAFMVATVILMSIVTLVTGLRILNTRALDLSRVALNQFSIRYLIGLTTVCAVLLGAGRLLASSAQWSASSFPAQLSQMLVSFGCILLVSLPPLVVPMIILSRRPRLSLLIVFPFIWVGVSWLAVEGIVAFAAPPRWEIVRDIALIQLGAASAGVVSAVLLRIAGYRLMRRQAAGSPTAAASI